MKILSVLIKFVWRQSEFVFFGALTSVGALFNYGGTDYVKTLNNSFFGGIVVSLAACGNSGSNENLEPNNVSESGSDLTVDNSDTMDTPPEPSKVAFDVTQFANISYQKIEKITSVFNRI